MGYRGDRRPIPWSNGLSLDDVRSRLSGLHFAKEQLSDGEKEILFLGECLLRYIDAEDVLHPWGVDPDDGDDPVCDLCWALDGDARCLRCGRSVGGRWTCECGEEQRLGPCAKAGVR